MKNFKARLAGILACLLLFIVPLQADAGWNASPLPAASINTVFGDSTYLNPEWMTKKVDHHLEGKHLDDRNGCIQGYACPPDQQ